MSGGLALEFRRGHRREHGSDAHPVCGATDQASPDDALIRRVSLCAYEAEMNLVFYAAGGHGRKLAFDDDYDLIILLETVEVVLWRKGAH